MSIDDGSNFMQAMIYVVIICVVLFFSMCSGTMVDPEDAVKSAESMGFSDVQITETHAFFVSWKGCSSTDAAMVELRAINPAGDPADLFVCMGWPFKGGTVRTK